MATSKQSLHLWKLPTAAGWGGRARCPALPRPQPGLPCMSGPFCPASLLVTDPHRAQATGAGPPALRAQLPHCGRSTPGSGWGSAGPSPTSPVQPQPLCSLGSLRAEGRRETSGVLFSRSRSLRPWEGQDGQPVVSELLGSHLGRKWGPAATQPGVAGSREGFDKHLIDALGKQGASPAHPADRRRAEPCPALPGRLASSATLRARGGNHPRMPEHLPAAEDPNFPHRCGREGAGP